MTAEINFFNEKFSTFFDIKFFPTSYLTLLSVILENAGAYYLLFIVVVSSCLKYVANILKQFLPRLKMYFQH